MNASLNKAEFRLFPGSLQTEYDDVILDVSEAVDRVNESIVRAVNAGMSVELVLNCRHHDGLGSWGDQMVPVLRERVSPAPVREMPTGPMDRPPAKPTDTPPYSPVDGEDGVCS